MIEPIALLRLPSLRLGLRFDVLLGLVYPEGAPFATSCPNTALRPDEYTSPEIVSSSSSSAFLVSQGKPPLASRSG